MNPPNPFRVTFDTNVCNVLEDTTKRPDQVLPEVAESLLKAIADGRILGYFSEASLYIECLSLPEKVHALKTAGNMLPRPNAPELVQKRFTRLQKLGLRALRVPVFSVEPYMPIEYANDEFFTVEERTNRIGEFLRGYNHRHQLVEYANELIQRQPELVHRIPPPPAAVRTGANTEHVELFDPLPFVLAAACEDSAVRPVGFNTRVGRILRNWSDTLAVGSHFGYGLDFFCTTDMGDHDGTGSPLHHGNRKALADRRIIILSPDELLAALTADR